MGYIETIYGKFGRKDIEKDITDDLPKKYTIEEIKMLRKCKVGKDSKPAFFHGWFQFGNADDGMDGMAVVEFEDGKTDYFSPGYITFDELPQSEINSDGEK